MHKVTTTEEQCGIQCKASHFESESDSFLLTQLIIIITDDVMIMIVNNVDSAKLLIVLCMFLPSEHRQWGRSELCC